LVSTEIVDGVEIAGREVGLEAGRARLSVVAVNVEADQELIGQLVGKLGSALQQIFGGE